MPVSTIRLHIEDINFSRLSGIAVDNSGTVFVSDFISNKIFRLVPSGNLYDLFVLGEHVETPRGLLLDGKGFMYIAHSHTISKLNLSDNSMKSILARPYNLAWPFQMALDPITEEIYYTERQQNPMIKKVKKDGSLELIGVPYARTSYADGNYETARFWHPSGIVINSKQEIFVCDAGNHCIRKLHNGVVTTIAGHPQLPGYCDGYANEAYFNSPCGLVLDRRGNLIIGDHGNRRIRKLDLKTGFVTTLAGNGVCSDEDGDFLQSSFMALKVPFLLAYNTKAVYVTDNHDSIGQIRILEAVPWKLARLLWIGKFKNEEDCPFAKLPRELVQTILQHLSAFDLGYEDLNFPYNRN